MATCGNGHPVPGNATFCLVCGDDDVRSTADSATSVGGTSIGDGRRARDRRWIAILAAVVVVMAGGGAALLFLGHQGHAIAAPSTSERLARSAPAASGTSAGSPSPSAPKVPAGQPSPAPAGSVQWTSPIPIDQQAFQNGNTISGMSCVSVNECFAVDSGGNVLQSDTQTKWAVVDTDQSAGLTGISCASAQFCIAVDSSGNVVVFSQGTWSDPIGIDSQASLTGVSCPTADFCVAVDNSGNAFTYTGTVTRWTAASVDTNSGLTSISCPSTTFCAAVDSSGNVFTSSNGSWSPGMQVDASYGFTQVSCASSAFCVAVDGSGGFAAFSSGQWSLGADGTSATAVSCPADGYCVAVDRSGGFVLYQQQTWSVVSKIDGNNTFSTLSCTTRRSCVGTDANNNVLYY